MQTRPYYAKHGKGLPLHVLDDLKELASTKFVEKKRNSGYSYWHGKKRALKQATYKNAFFIELTFTISDRDGLLTLTDEDRQRLHAGATRQCYVGSDLEMAKRIIETAFEHFRG